VLLVNLGSPGWADTTVAHFRVNGDTAIALFQAIDPTDACIEFVVSVVTSDLMQKVSPGPQTSNVGTVLVVAVRDVCQDLVLLLGAGETAQQTFQVAGNLSTATLNTTVTVIDIISTLPYTFAVNLTWTALGPPERTHETQRFQDKEAGILIVTQFQGTKVDAEATGTVVGVGENFTPEPSSSAEIDAQNDGTVIVEMTH
jgi:hypothetical protein